MSSFLIVSLNLFLNLQNRLLLKEWLIYLKWKSCCCCVLVHFWLDLIMRKDVLLKKKRKKNAVAFDNDRSNEKTVDQLINEKNKLFNLFILHQKKFFYFNFWKFYFIFSIQIKFWQNKNFYFNFWKVYFFFLIKKFMIIILNVFNGKQFIRIYKTH